MIHDEDFHARKHLISLLATAGSDDDPSEPQQHVIHCQVCHMAGSQVCHQHGCAHEPRQSSQLNCNLTDSGDEGYLYMRRYACLMTEL